MSGKESSCFYAQWLTFPLLYEMLESPGPSEVDSWVGGRLFSPQAFSPALLLIKGGAVMNWELYIHR